MSTDDRTPKLPEPAGDIRLPGAFGLATDGYTADQMREHAAACVRAERERAAKAVEAFPHFITYRQALVAAIRKGD
jgi:hypothetical protein